MLPSPLCQTPLVQKVFRFPAQSWILKPDFPGVVRARRVREIHAAEQCAYQLATIIMMSFSIIQTHVEDAPRAVHGPSPG